MNMDQYAQVTIAGVNLCKFSRNHRPKAPTSSSQSPTAFFREPPRKKLIRKPRSTCSLPERLEEPRKRWEDDINDFQKQVLEEMEK